MRSWASFAALSVALLVLGVQTARAQGPCAKAADGLVVYYPFNGNAADASGNGRDATVNGAVLAADRFGRPNAAYAFNGSTDYLSTADYDGLHLTEAMSVSAWVKLDPSYSGGIVYIADKYHDASDPLDRFGWLLSVEGHKVRYYNSYTRTPPSYDILYSQTSLATDEWYHIVAETDSTSLRIFINGVEDVSMPKTGTLGFSPKDLSIGRSYVDSHYFPGMIDDVRIYRNALSAANVHRLWVIESSPGASLREGLAACYALDGDVTDASGNGNDGTFVGAVPTIDRFGFPNNAFAFNGISDYLSIPDSETLRITGRIAVSGWVKLDPSYSGGIVYIADKYHDASDPLDRFGWLLSVEGHKVRYYNSYTRTPPSYDILYSQTSLATDEWYHIVATTDDSELRVFINGVQDASMPKTGTLGFSPKDLSIGRSCVDSHYFPGMIDDVRIYGRYLSASEVTALHAAQSSPADNEPPTLDLPADFTVSATGPSGATVTFVASATDAVSGEVPVTCSPASESVFPLGATAVTCWASDQAGNTASSAFTVTVRASGATVQLTDSHGGPLSGGVVQYYSGGWLAFGTTGVDGSVFKAITPGTYTFRMILGGGVYDKVQNVAADPVVSFQTTLVSVRLQTSAGAGLDTGTIQYYAGGWRDFGVTSGGQATRELLPLNYTFRMTYGGGNQDKVQNVAADPTVRFATTLVTVELKSSSGAPLDTGTVQYYAAGWRPLGSTAGGQVSLELLPLAYTFRMTYAGGSQSKAQNVSTASLVVFQTGAAHSDSGSCTQYYAVGWRAFVQDMELLPLTYTFRFNDGTSDQQYAVVATSVTHIH